MTESDMRDEVWREETDEPMDYLLSHFDNITLSPHPRKSNGVIENAD